MTRRPAITTGPQLWVALILLAIGAVTLVAGAATGDFRETAASGSST